MLPSRYEWLTHETGPAILIEALKLFGTKEIHGAQHNPVILNWAKELGGSVAAFYNSDEIAWCGLFMAICCHRAGLEPLPGFDALRALKWARWGSPTDRPMLGDVLTFKRPSGGHVGLYVGEDTDCFHVLGGNQGDAVSIIRVDKLRLVAVRRTIGPISKNVRRIFMTAEGDISKNEA